MSDCGKLRCGGALAADELTHIFPGLDRWVFANLKVSEGEYIKHWSLDRVVYHICFRLADSVPQEKLQQWEEERKELAERQNRNVVLSEEEIRRLKYLYGEKVEKYLDAGHGECLLSKPGIGDIVSRVLMHDSVGVDGFARAGCGAATQGGDMRCGGALAAGNRCGTATQGKYKIHAFGIMSNHVHVIVDVVADFHIGEIVTAWKSVSGHLINKALARKGPVWQRDHYDHIIRTADEYRFQMNYVYKNDMVKSWRCDEGDRGEGAAATQNTRGEVSPERSEHCEAMSLEGCAATTQGGDTRAGGGAATQVSAAAQD